MCSQPRPSEAIFSRKFFGSLYCHSKTCHPFIATQKYVIPSLPSVYILRSLQCHSVNSVGNGVWRSSCTRRQGAVTIRTSRARDVVRTGTAKRAPLPPPRLRTPWRLQAPPSVERRGCDNDEEEMGTTEDDEEEMGTTEDAAAVASCGATGWRRRMWQRRSCSAGVPFWAYARRRAAAPARQHGLQVRPVLANNLRIAWKFIRGLAYSTMQ
jgi:hypothetical protein